MRKECVEQVAALLRDKHIIGDVLDVGGAGTIYQQEQGYDFPKLFAEYNVAYNIADIKSAPGVDWVVDFTNGKLPRKFRNIICTNMLEHTKDPVAVIKNLWLHIREGGVMLVSVPDVYGVHNESDYFRFTELGLKMLLEKWEIIEVGRWGSKESGDLEHFVVCKKPINSRGQCKPHEVEKTRWGFELTGEVKKKQIWDKEKKVHVMIEGDK